MTAQGLAAANFANVAHGIITGLLFFVVGAVKDRTGSTDADGVGRAMYGRAPQLASVFAFGAMASLGLPGLAGFWGEMLAMLAAYQPTPELARGTYLAFMARRRRRCGAHHGVLRRRDPPDLPGRERPADALVDVEPRRVGGVVAAARVDARARACSRWPCSGRPCEPNSWRGGVMTQAIDWEAIAPPLCPGIGALAGAARRRVRPARPVGCGRRQPAPASGWRRCRPCRCAGEPRVGVLPARSDSSSRPAAPGSSTTSPSPGG